MKTVGAPAQKKTLLPGEKLSDPREGV